jgi:hypothetical protein
MTNNKKIFALFLLAQCPFICHAMNQDTQKLQLLKDCYTITDFDTNEIKYDNHNEIIAYAHWFKIVYEGYIAKLNNQDDKAHINKFNSIISSFVKKIDDNITEIADKLNKKIRQRINKINGNGINSEWNTLDPISPLMKAHQYNKGPTIFNRNKKRFVIIMEEIADYHHIIHNELYWYLSALKFLRPTLEKLNPQSNANQNVTDNGAFSSLCTNIKVLKIAIKTYRGNVKDDNVNYIFEDIKSYINEINKCLAQFITTKNV